MREVAIFLSPSLYDSNLQFVKGWTNNDICVTRFDSSDSSYIEAVRHHQNRIVESPDGGVFSQWYYDDDDELSNNNNNNNPDFHFLCIAIENSCKGVVQAKAAGMCVIGIGSNPIECETLEQGGAHTVAQSLNELLFEKFKVKKYYQIQYLPYTIYLKDIAKKKTGYPASLLDTLSGRFIVQEKDGNHTRREIELDSHAERFIPRDVLGISPGSLADVYINNVGWPQDNIKSCHFQTRGLEMDIIRMFAKLYKIEEMRGFITTGGTEGNFTGLWWQRDYLKSNNSAGVMPILVTSQMTHYSITKAAQQLGMEVRRVQVIPNNGAIDCQHLETVLTEIMEGKQQTQPPDILMNVNMGTTCTGSIDNLPLIHQILKEKVVNSNFSIHLDAALMGSILPFINPFSDNDDKKKNVNYFRDFDVKTIAISGHKFFGSVCICGVLLTSQQFLQNYLNSQKNSNSNINYVQGLHDITPSGSRSGFHVLSLHNTLCGLDMHTRASKLHDIVHHCYSHVEYFLSKMNDLVGKENVIHPDHSLTICFPRPSEKLMEKWTLMPVTLPSLKDENEYAAVCILINIDKKRIHEFMDDYEKDEKARLSFVS